MGTRQGVNPIKEVITMTNYREILRLSRIKTIKPYYLNTSLVDENGEPLVERDFEG